MKELPSIYQTYVHKSRYARYVTDHKRRETWEETVTRYIEAMVKQVEKQNDSK